MLNIDIALKLKTYTICQILKILKILQLKILAYSIYKLYQSASTWIWQKRS